MTAWDTTVDDVDALRGGCAGGDRPTGVTGDESKSMLHHAIDCPVGSL